jgi:ELWxxDGT repeat protein
LWVSDGTATGTQLLKDINPTAGTGSNPLFFKNFYGEGNNDVLYNGKVFFLANNGTTGNELWITDGTSAGTVLVKDIRPGTPSGISTSSLSYFYTTSGLYFSATDGSGVEPWLSNGTDAGTARVFDVNTTTGTAGSNPQYLFIYNNQVYFNGTNGDDPNNTDLFKINATTSILPITLLNLSATVEANNTVKLDWTTSSEINSSHFEVERSIDGVKFNKLSDVKAAGSSTMNLNYSYADQQAAALNVPLLYYRLKLVDKDGSSKSSSTLLVRLKESSLQFSIAPNPAQQQLNVMVVPGSARKVAMRIVDAGGKLVYQQTLPARVNINQQNINVSHLQKGVYYIQLITDKTTTTQKFIKE